MASFFTRALDKITPWRMPGEVQRDQQVRKKIKDEEYNNNNQHQSSRFSNPSGASVGASIGQYNQNTEAANQPLQPKKPVNIFEDLNKNLTLGQPSLNSILVQKNPNSTLAPKPQPGQVIQPTKPVEDTPENKINRGLDAGKSWQQIARENNFRENGVADYSRATRPNYGIKLDKPKQSFGNKIRDVFDANTEIDKYHRQEGNLKLQPQEQQKPLTLVNPGNLVSRTPVVGTVNKMLNTAGAQIAELPATIGGSFASSEYSAATEEYTKAVKSGDKTKIAAAKQRLEGAVNRTDAYNRQQDAGHEMFQKNKGGLFNSGTLYDEGGSRKGDVKTGLKDIVLPTAVTALDLYTLGQGAAITEGLKTGVGRTALRTVAPNVARATAGNFGSGSLDTISQGGSATDAVKAGGINAALGLIPDVGLPALTRNFNQRVLPKIMNGRNVNPADVVNELDDAAISASAEAANQALKPKPISVRAETDIPIKSPLDPGVNVPVTVKPQPMGNQIKEISGDFGFKPMEQLQQIRVDAQRAQANDFNNATSAPDRSVEGVTPRTFSDMTGATRKSIEEERLALDEALANKEINKTAHKAANKELDDMVNTADPSVPKGRKIEVKQADTIPVTSQTIVPQGLPEKPGTVRATIQTAPNEVRTEAVANAPVVNTPVSLPAEVQAVLDNPKQFNKRQVASARNQRKLARQMAKTNEETAVAMDRIDTASPAAASGESFAPTGEFGRSTNGGTYQKANRAAEMQQAVQETSQMSPGDVLQTARRNQAETGGFNRRDIRNIAAMFETKRIPRGTSEWQEARQILKEDGTVWGQQGALRNYTMRRTASADELTNRYESKIYRLVDDPSKIEGKYFDEVEAAETAFTESRDTALQAYNRFTENPTRANAKAFHVAQDVAEKADKTAKMTEYKIADKVLKGNKDIKQTRELEKMAQNADMYQMDAVDASMLSGTGTFVRNFVNTAVGGTEEGLFGKVASRIAGKITGENVGGGVGRGTMSGFGEGVSNIVDASKARASNAGKNPLGHVKNWATTGNQLGDSVLDSQTKHNVIDHYRQLLKDQGYKGRELTDRASVMARQDPDNLGHTYANAARTAAGLGAGVTRNNKIETIVKNMISDAISGGKPNALTEGTAKLVTRMTLGFPTAIGRSTVEGVKRFTLGAPTFIKAMRTSDTQARAILIKEGIKQAGSGAMVIPPLFYAMGASGAITGSYPTDPEERARWEREGITENSVRIGGSYYQLPSYLGAWAVPGLFYASLGRNEGNFGAAATDAAKTIPALLPTDQASNIMDVVNGRTDPGKFMAQLSAGAVRATTPGGALLNQLSKSFDPTKNDTSGGTNIENFVDKVLSGIPGVNNMAGIPGKEDDAGNPIHNPSPFPLAFGASSAVQGKGEERSTQIGNKVSSDIQNLMDIGVLDDPNLKGILNDKELAVYSKFKDGKKLGQGDVKKLQEAFVRGVSQTGDNTAYLEREQYDTNLAALKLKRQLMNADKAVKPSDIKKIDIAIKRGGIYKEGEIPYSLIDAYQTTGVETWRKMGDPESDSYDPDMYQKLWSIDERLTEAGVSYKKGALDKAKYFNKEKKGRHAGGGGHRREGGGGGSSRSGSASYSSDFGTLKASAFAPSVQAYETIDQKSGNVPVIRTVRPNIVHKIGSSG